MSSDIAGTAVFFAVLCASEIVVAYSGYIALSVRRGLATPIFRSRALFTAAIAVLAGGASLFGRYTLPVLLPGSSRSQIEILQFLVVYPGGLAVFYAWIDRTIGALIQTDYLRRDVLWWKRLRVPYWSTLAVFVALQFVFFPISKYPVPTIAGTALLTFSMLYGSVAIVLGSSRTWDKTFRAQMKWSGYCIGTFLADGLLNTFVPYPVVDVLPLLLVSYCLYKMAKNLVPSQRLELGPPR